MWGKQDYFSFFIQLNDDIKLISRELAFSHQQGMKKTETYDAVSNLVEVTQPVGGGGQSPVWASLTSVDIGLAVGVNTNFESVALSSGNSGALRLLA